MSPLPSMRTAPSLNRKVYKDMDGSSAVALDLSYQAPVAPITLDLDDSPELQAQVRRPNLAWTLMPIGRVKEEPIYGERYSPEKGIGQPQALKDTPEGPAWVNVDSMDIHLNAHGWANIGVIDSREG